MTMRVRGLRALCALGAVLCGVSFACSDGSRHVVAVHNAFVVPGAGLAPGVLYATITNGTSAPDTLVAIAALTAKSIDLHGTSMQVLDRLVAPAGENVRLAPGGLHGMITGLRPGIAPGDAVPVTFRFAHAGALVVYARVIDYAQVDSAVMGGRR